MRCADYTPGVNTTACIGFEPGSSSLLSTSWIGMCHGSLELEDVAQSRQVLFQATKAGWLSYGVAGAVEGTKACVFESKTTHNGMFDEGGWCMFSVVSLKTCVLFGFQAVKASNTKYDIFYLVCQLALSCIAQQPCNVFMSLRKLEPLPY